MYNCIHICHLLVVPTQKTIVKWDHPPQGANMSTHLVYNKDNEDARNQRNIHLQVLTAWNCAPKYLSVGNTPTKGIISHLLWQVPIFVKIRSICGSQGLEMVQYSSLMVELFFLQELKHFFVDSKCKFYLQEYTIIVS